MIPEERKKALEAGEVDQKDLNVDDLQFLVTNILQNYIKFKGPFTTTFADVAFTLDVVKADFINQVIMMKLHEAQKHKPRIQVAQQVPQQKIVV